MDAPLLLAALLAFAAGAIIAWLSGRAQLAALQARLEGERAANEARSTAQREAIERERAQLADLQARFTDAFKALSADALKSNNTQFLEQARLALAQAQEAAKGDLELRQQKIGELINPMRETLAQVDAKIQELEKARVGAYEGMTAQIASLMEAQARLQHEAVVLRSEASGLRQALRNPTVRGRWGEIQLQRVVEMAGMLEHVDFEVQESVDASDGEVRRRLRPDMVIKLPNGRTIVVDAKAPTDAYLDAVESSDEDARRAKLAEFARRVRDHVDALARKAYWEQFAQTPDFVVMFLPGEHLYSAALEQDSGLIEVGVAQNVVLATPTTLIALLRAVAFGWRQEQLTENARKISGLGADLYKRLSTLGEHLSRLGRSLNGAVNAYNQAIGSAERMVVPKARELKELGAVHDGAKEIDLDVIEESARPVQSPELLGACAEEPPGLLSGEHE